jgi:hypothetical protein
LSKQAADVAPSVDHLASSGDTGVHVYVCLCVCTYVCVYMCV